MLLLIFGAGASYDSVPPEALPDVPLWNYQPPLANELLDNRSSFGEVLDRFPQCLPLINPLRRKAASTGFALEKELELLLAEADQYGLRKRQFAAFRFYLQQALWECAENWGSSAHWSTNYVELVSRIDVWRARRRERVAVVTFNYDTFIERALGDALGRSLSTMESYVRDPEWRVFKVHGSVHWGRDVLVSWNGRGDARTYMIENLDDLIISDEFFIRPPDHLPAGNERLLLPAIAIPVVSKSASSFECPKDHLRVLQDVLPLVTKVLVIGWRGMEAHFLDLVRANSNQIHSVLAVTADEAEARNLARAFPQATACAHAWEGRGFSTFLGQDSELEAWLG